MKVSSEDFEAYLSTASFRRHGDSIERAHSSMLAETFPLCEEFWRQFVVPLTRRIHSYPSHLSGDIRFRDTTDPLAQDLARCHYSMYLNLIFAHLHISENTISPLEDVYVHLAAACDLAEAVVLKWLVLASESVGKSIPLLQGLSREDFLELAGQWYDRRYKDLYSIFKDQRRHPRIDLPGSFEVLVEFLGKESASRVDYENIARPIRTYRNVIVHDSSIARVVTKDGQILVPKSSMINSYKTWKDVADATKEDGRLRTDFAPLQDQCLLDAEALEGSLNAIWQHLVHEFREQFYSLYNPGLRDRFDISFSPGPTVLGYDPVSPSPSTDYEPPPSGTYSGGSADYPP